jgi:signal transduction histidine kinase
VQHHLRRWVAAGRARTRSERVVDVALSLAAATFNVLFVLFPDAENAYDGESRQLALVIAAAVAGLVLVVRRSHPLLTFLVVVAIIGVITLLQWDAGGLPFTMLLAAYALGAYGSDRDSIIALAATVAGAGLFAVRPPSFDTVLDVAEWGVASVAWLLGRVVARRRADADGARQRELTLAREGARATERAVLAERLRVARDLNDGASDAIATITLQAAVGRRAAGDPDGVLAMIERHSRDATDDLRRLLLALRDPARTPVLDDADPELRRALVDATGWDDHPASLSEPTARRAPDWPVDVALGLGVAVLNVTGSVAPDPSTTSAGADPVLPALVALAAVPGLALIIRRQYPVATLALVVAAVSAVTALDWRTGNMPGTVLIATYALGAWTTIRRGVTALVGLFAVIGIVTVLGLGFGDNDDAWAAPVLFTMPWVLGAVIRQRRLSDEQQVERALAAEREFVVATERALENERLAVARDLHDLVSHNLAAITLQAAAARRRPGNPDPTALAAIEQAGRAALADLRAMLDALAGPVGGDLAPAPGLADLEALANRHRESNGPLEFSIDPALEHEPESVRLTAYRVVQEALTNVHRHAPGARVTVRLAATDGTLVVDVENDRAVNSLPRSPGSGLGLAGMRERVSLFGGTVTAGATAAGGFAVHAELSRGATR